MAKAKEAKAAKQGEKSRLTVIAESDELTSDSESGQSNFALTLSGIISSRNNKDPTTTFQMEKSSILASFEKTQVMQNF